MFILNDSSKWFLTIGFLASVLISCSDKKPTSDSGATDSLLVKYQALNDSVESNWNIMIADDDDKHLLMKRLLLEISYTNNYDKDRFDQFNQLIDDLKSMRYDQKSMSNSSSIDEYDSATFALSDEIIRFARSHPRYEDFPLMAELIDDINAKNNYILLHRIHYDNWVKELNSFKAANKEKLMSSDPAIDIQKMPLFELPS
ncbi:MAG: hypothetical protein MI975_19925 [Cytophagales bacterium]|nr:hypothetical protein [Cytophagales bacterium]